MVSLKEFDRIYSRCRFQYPDRICWYDRYTHREYIRPDIVRYVCGGNPGHIDDSCVLHSHADTYISPPARHVLDRYAAPLQPRPTGRPRFWKISVEGFCFPAIFKRWRWYLTIRNVSCGIDGIRRIQSNKAYA